MNALVKHLQDVSEGRSRWVATSCSAEASSGRNVSLEQEAYERGVGDTLMRTSATIEQALSAADQSVASLHAQWTAECQERICREAAMGRSLIEERLSEELMRSLSKFIEGRQMGRIREAFLQCLREALATNAEMPIKLFGPADERRIVVDCLGEMGITAVYVDRDGSAIDAEIGPRVIRADFASWSRLWLDEFGDGLVVRS